MKPSRYRNKQRSGSRRPVDRYELRQRFLIVCEGRKTEPNYFKKFPIPPSSVVDVLGLGENTLSLVKETIRLSQEDKYDQVWCVFDRDDFSAENFNAAIRLAKKNHIRVAYSNEAFELWYVLHFRYLDSGITRKDYIHCLDQDLCHEYRKNDPNIYLEIESYQVDAIRNAKRLLLQYHNQNPAECNPSTTVHQLVEQLNKLYLWPI